MDIGAIFKKVAPWLAAAATGPAGLAGMAIKTASEVLGAKDETIDGITAAIAGATPDQLRQFKEADQQFALQMQSIGFKNVESLEAIAAGDRADARKMQTLSHSLVPALLTWFLVSSFVGSLLALFLREVPVANRDMIVYMIGQLSGFTGAAIAFWLGTTRESARKNDMLAQSSPQK